MIATAVEIVISVGIVLGAAFALVGSIGLIRLRDPLQRLHAPTKSSTLGLGCVLAASVTYFAHHSDQPALNELLIAAFVFATAPVAAQMLAKAVLRTGEGARHGMDDPAR